MSLNKTKKKHNLIFSTTCCIRLNNISRNRINSNHMKASVAVPLHCPSLYVSDCVLHFLNPKASASDRMESKPCHCTLKYLHGHEQDRKPQLGHSCKPAHSRAPYIAHQSILHKQMNCPYKLKTMHVSIRVTEKENPFLLGSIPAK